MVLKHSFPLLVHSERDGSMPNNTGTGLNISHNMSYGVINLNVKCLNHHQCTEEIGKEG